MGGIIDLGLSGIGEDYLSQLESNPWISDYDGTYRTLYGTLGDDNISANGDPLEAAITSINSAIGGLVDSSPIPKFTQYTLVGGAGNDTLTGGDYSDKLYGGDGDDHLYGGKGDDIFFGGKGNNFIDGGDGTDTVSYELTDGGQQAGTPASVKIDSIGTVVTALGGQQTDDLHSIERLDLTNNDDTVVVTSWNNHNAGLLIDGLGQTDAAGDTLDFSQMDSPVVFEDGGGVRAKIRDANGTDPITSYANEIHYKNFEYVVGTSGNDVYEDGTTVNARVDLGGGADVVKSAGKGSIIDLGANDGASDTVYINGDTEILNFGNEDRVSVGGFLTAFGGLRNMMSDSPYASEYGGLVKYGLTKSGDLLISLAVWGDPTTDNTMTIAGWGGSYNHLGIPYLGNGDITLAQYKVSAALILADWTGMGTIWGTWELFGLMTKVLTGHNSWGNIDPLVLDLNGDGFNLGIMSDAAPKFDTKADLYKAYSGWVGANDGFLVRDINHDGQIDDSREMFGGEAGSGFAVLATLDGNHDGLVDANDNGLADFNGDGVIDASDRFDDLQVWQDLNQDGVVETGELKSLADLGIVSFTVASTPDSETINGNLITATSTFTRADGTTGADGDAILKLDNQNTTYAGPDITISTAAAAEPELKGYGTLVSLRQALSVAPGDVSLVDATMNSLNFNVRDMASLRNDIRPLLAAWADGSPIRDAAGDIIHGPDAVAHYEDTPLIRLNDRIIDYAWDVHKSTAADGTTTQSWTFNSGLQLTLTTPNGVTPASLADLHADLGNPASTVTASQTVDGVQQTTVTYTYADGEVLASTTFGNMSTDAAATASRTLVTIMYGEHTVDDTGNYVVTSVLGSDVDFFERYLGETLPLHVKPDDPSTALGVVQAAVDGMEQTLNVIAARVAVQSPTFAPVFSDLVYDAGSDTFHATSDLQLIPTFTHLLTLAGAQSDPLAWLQSWDPLLNVIIGDFDRGNGALNTNGFLAQNIIAAYEAAQPSFDLLTAVKGLGLDPSQFVTGSGDLQGSDNPDIFYLSGGDQTASGGLGLDNYIVGSHFGHDVINDIEPALSPASDDVVRFTSLNSSDVTLTRDGEDLIVTVNATGSTLKITGEFHGEWPDIMGGSDWADEGVANMIFADGTTWDRIDMARAASHPDPASTLVVGTASSDFLDGGAGDDTLEGKGGGDIYVFGRGYDHDTILDVEDNPLRQSFDVLAFRTGISENDLVFHRDGNSNDLTITIAGDTADSVTIDGQFAAAYTGVFGTVFTNQIEMFTFADGGSLSADDIDQKIIDQSETDGNDTIYGFNRDDTLIGGKGDDFLSGGNGNDTYVFNLGDGHDTISDQEGNILGGENDTLRFGPGISASDVVFTRDGSDLIATIASTGDSVRIKGEYDFTETGVFGVRNFNLIENFSFADGTTKGWRSIMDSIVQASETSGDDHVVGTHFNDTIVGGTGNDLLEGGDGDDTYVFNIGDGHDTVNDVTGNILAGGDNDTIVFGPGISPSDIHIERTGDALENAVLTYDSAGDSITINGQFTYGSINFRGNEIEHFIFADGTSWTPDDPRKAYIAQHETSGNDVITGFYTDDTLDGGTGDDTLRGGDGSDTYKFEMGFGHDRIEENVLNAAYADNDQIIFGPGLNSTDATLTRSGDDLIIGFAGMSGTVTVAGDFTHVANYDGWQDVETVTFGDGVSWSLDDIRHKLIAQSETGGNDTVTGFWTADTLDGGAGDDLLIGNAGGDTFRFGIGDGHDTVVSSYSPYDAPTATDTVSFKAGVTADSVTFAISGNDLVATLADGSDVLTVRNQFTDAGEVENFTFADGTTLSAAAVAALAIAHAETSGADMIQGSSGADVFDGGPGNDTIYGNGGADTFLFGHGSGIDTVYETIDHVAHPATATLRFKADVAPGDVVFSRNINDLVVSLNGTADAVWVKGFFTSDSNKIDQFVFADGTTYDASQVTVMTHTGTTGNDVMYGSTGAETLDGKGGQDVIHGNGGSDTFIYAAGYGQLEIDEQNTDPTAASVLSLSGITSSQVTVTRDVLGNITLTDGASGDSVLLDNMASSTSGTRYGVQSISFADGVTWSAADVLSRAAAAAPTNDNIYGTSGPDTLDGHGGNDYIQGNGGNDTFIFNSGYGHLDINEYDTNSGANNVLRLGAGISPSAITFAGDRFGDIFLADGVTGDRIMLENELSGGAFGVQSVAFADGTTWTQQDLITKEMTGTSGADNIYGTLGADTLDGHGGSDYIQGKGGGDTFVFNSGYGHLEVDEYDTAGSPHNVLQFGTGVAPGDVAIATDRFGDILLTDTVTGDQVTLDNEASGSAYGVQSVAFADGTTWSRAYLMDAKVIGTTGNDNLQGTAGVADVLDGKGGNDYEDGKGGNDTFIFNGGYGHLEINEYDTASGAANVLQLGPGITSNALTVTGDRFGDIMIADGVTGDQVTLDSEMSGASYGVQWVTFSDGTTWTRQDLINKELTGTTTANNIYGTSGADLIDGHGGSDYVQGKGGGDTFVYNSAYGHLEVDEYDTSGSPSNSLHLGTGINPADIVVTADRFSDLILTDAVSGDQITLDSMLSGSSYGVQSLVFSDGTTWSRQDLIDKALNGTSGPDAIYGTPGNDTIDGHAGNDTIVAGNGDDYIIGDTGDDDLTGGSGADTFVFRPGFGHDTIEDFTSSQSDIIEISSSLFVDYNDVMAHATTVGSNVVITYDAADTITLKNMTLANLHATDFHFV